MQRAIAAIALACLALGGCVSDGSDGSIVVLRAIIGTAAMGGGCTLSNAETELGLAQGTLDVQGRTGYQIAVQIRSRITALAGQEDQRAIFTRGANVDIAFSDPALATTAGITKDLTHFKASFAARLPPNGGVTDVSFELIPAEVAAALAATSFTSVVADTSFTIVGDLAGGNVSSQTFHFPVTIVKAGLIQDRGMCSALSTGFMPRVGNPCNPVQDGVVDCCTDANNRQLCPAVGTKTGFTGAVGPSD